MRLAVGLSMLAAWLLATAPAHAQTAAPRRTGPLDQVGLASLGYQDQTLRGRLVSTDYFVPGPGNYALNDDNWIDLSFRPSDLLSEQSVMTVLWNGVPLQEVALQPSSDITRLAIQIPSQRVDPGVNRLQVQAALQIRNEDCVEENPARTLTIFNTSDVRYGYRDREPIALPINPDLARYPAPFSTQNDPQPATVRVVVPPNPSSSELTAAVRVVTQLGQSAGTRGLPLQLSTDDGQIDASAEHLIFVGRDENLPSLAQVPNPPGGVRRTEDGSYVDDAGQPVPSGTGVVFEVRSPWNPARAALVVSGADDQAVERAASVVSGREGIRALHGQSALVSEIQPPAVSSSGPTPTLLSDLGRSDDTIAGVGEHAISFSIEAASLAGSSSLPLDLDTSHSPLLDSARSSFRVVLNGAPVATTSFRDLPASRGHTRVDLPAAALKPGSNTLSIEFDLSLPRLDDQQCARIPTEQAWAVLHADSALVPTDTPGNAGDVTLASYPFPFVRAGRIDTSLFVLPNDLGDGTALLRLVADLGRATRASVLAPRAVRASEFDATMAADSDVIVWGLPDANPVLGRLGDRLPIQVDQTGRRLVLSRDLTLAVRDASRLGVVEEVASPWSGTGHEVLAVSATSAADLTLAVDALRQGSLTGNAALASRAVPQSVIAGRTPTPEPLVLGGPPPEPLEVSTFRLRPRIEAPSVVAARRPPYIQYAAGVLAAAASVVALALAYRAFAPGSDR
jgi:Bacterial cellulose synthase subunit